MLNVKKLVVLVMVLVLMGNFIIAAFASSPIDMEEIASSPDLNPYEYGVVPDEIYLFIYRGTAPYLSVDIDTSTCVLNRLYVYNETDDSVIEISEQNTKEYTATVDALFYVTESNDVYKSDYTGQCTEFIYHGDSGVVENMKCYYDMFAFTQDDDIILMDLAERTTQTLWTCNDIDYFFILSETELLIVTLLEEFYIYDILIAEPRAVDAEEFNCRLGQLQPSSAGTQNSDASVMTVYPGGLEYYENDISFPLPEYPVNYEISTYYQNYHYPDPASWFHENTMEGCIGNNCTRYAGAGECMGFARYVHDKYNHMLDYTITNSNPDQWYVGKNMHHAVRDDEGNWVFPYYFENSAKKVRTFFANLQTGNYVRYGRSDDDTIADGRHSIVLVGKDDNGIWVYECNQNYYKDLDSDRINGRPKSYFGCGVHLQYHTYATLAERYHFIVKYTNHTYTEVPAYDDAIYHRVGCTCCVGYLRQKHDEVSTTFVTAARHRATFNCCDGRTVNSAHTGTLTYQTISEEKHRVSAACCSGYIEVAHTFRLNSNNRYVCTGCGYVEGMIITGLEPTPISK